MNARHATAAGEALLSLEHVSLSFGGVNAISDVSFDIRKGEIPRHHRPQRRGKTSMLNVINGFYQPQIGRILFRGEARSRMRPYEAASQGIARTFQNVALFKGMTTLDNIMTGRNLRMKKNLFWQALRHGPALEEEIAHRRVCENHRFSRNRAYPQDPVGALPIRPAKAGRARAARWRWSRNCCCSTSRWPG